MTSQTVSLWYVGLDVLVLLEATGSLPCNEMEQ